MPRAAIASRWRAMRSRFAIVSACALLAIAKGPRVARSLTTARRSSRAAPTRAMTPSSGCMRKMKAMNSGNHGASSSGKTPGPVMNPRTCERSRSTWPAPAPPAVPPSVAASSGRDSFRSIQTPMRTSRRERTMSIRPISAKDASAAMVSSSSVSWLRLVMTRSKTWIMYMGIVSMSRLITKLNAPMPTSARRQARTTSSSSGAGALAERRRRGFGVLMTRSGSRPRTCRRPTRRQA